MEQSTNKKNERATKGPFVFWLAVSVALVGLEQFAKYLAFHGPFGSFLNVLAPAVKKYRYFNYNFAFSLPIPPVLMYLVYAIILILIFWHIFRHYQNFVLSEKLAWSLILAGALSNIFEHAFLGYVRDFVYVFSGIFNLADFYIILGVVTLLAKSMMKNNANYAKSNANDAK